MTEGPLASILARLGRVPLYIIFMRATALQDLESEEGQALQVEHLQWQLDMEKRGVLLGAGPLDWFDKDEARPRGDRPIVDAFGMSIIAAASRAEAERIAKTEPFLKKGWRENIVCSWQLNEGRAIELGRQLVAGVAGTRTEARP